MTSQPDTLRPVRDADMPCALIVVDVQQGFDEPEWGQRNNPGCEANIGSLLDRWRAKRWPIVYVRHDSLLSGSPLAPGQPGNGFKAELGPPRI